MTDDRTLAGRYRLAGLIGAGGMGAVYRATDLRLRRTVAVKVLPGALADHDPIGVARFEREARAAARVSHPGVVRVFDAGTDGGTRFIVMEHVDGHSLEAIVRGEAPLEPAHAARIGRQVADALSAAHAAGIVHRDVKPANVIVADDGTVRVLDFGVARILERTALTGSAALLGTATYMSPEQALGEEADARSDIYSLGCVLYAMLTGAPPFTADAVAAILLAHAHSEPPPPSRRNGRVWPGLDALVLEMLAKSAAGRPQTAAGVRDRLDQELGSVRTTRRLPVAVAPAPATVSVAVTARGRGSRGAAAGVAILAVAAVVTVLAIDPDSRPRRVPARAGAPAAARPRPHTTATRVSVSPPPAGAGPASQAPAVSPATAESTVTAAQAATDSGQPADNGGQPAGNGGQPTGDGGQPAGQDGQPPGQAKQDGQSGGRGQGGGGD